MTPAQDKKYWRRWQAVCRANHWHWRKGRLDPMAKVESLALVPRPSALAQVWSAAEARAGQRVRAVTADDLRHACHIVALGRDKSHADLSNKEFDALLNLWGDERTITGLLIEPLDLASSIAADHPEQKTGERQLRWLRQECLGGYVAAESDRLFGTKDWEQLPADDLARLHDHLRARPNGQVAANVSSRGPRSTETRLRDADPDWNV